MSDGKTSPWVYVGWGCAVVAALIVLAVGGMAWWGYRLAKGIERDFKDPAARQAKTRAVVPYETLPAGYHPLGGISVPFLMDMAMFTDRPPDAIDQGDEFDRSAFFFISVRSFDPKDEEEFLRFLRGEGPEPEALARANVGYEAREAVAQGTLEAGGGMLLYQARRGSLDTDQGEAEGVVDIFLVDCPRRDDNRMRIGIWFGPDPNPAAAAAEADWTGTPADPEALRAFAGHFSLCGA